MTITPKQIGEYCLARYHAARAEDGKPYRCGLYWTDGAEAIADDPARYSAATRSAAACYLRIAAAALRFVADMTGDDHAPSEYLLSLANKLTTKD